MQISLANWIVNSSYSACRMGITLYYDRRAGDDTGAQRELHRAEGIAAANGLLQILAEEGDGLAAAPPASARPVKGNSVRVIPEGSLSPREIEILRLVGDGLSNAEVGQRLSLVEGSVKWHLQRIYDKIGTRRRLVAVDRARRMGLFR